LRWLPGPRRLIALVALAAVVCVCLGLCAGIVAARRAPLAGPSVAARGVPAAGHTLAGRIIAREGDAIVVQSRAGRTVRLQLAPNARVVAGPAARRLLIGDRIAAVGDFKDGVFVARAVYLAGPGRLPTP
jgi:hypothetical protein